MIFASNTSTLPITSLAAEFKDPPRFIGIHFFSPVDRMMLVEIILGKKTGDKALAAALDYVRADPQDADRRQRLRAASTPTAACSLTSAKAYLMLLEGVPAAMIENAARMAGMPVGPLSLNDETALDLGLKIMRAAEADLGAGAVNPAAEEAAGGDGREERPLRPQERQGLLRLSARASRSGCGRASPICCRRSLTREQVEALDVEEMKQRFLVMQALEAARSFEEQVVTDVREADVGSILGWGFAPFSGGTLSYIDMMGTKKFVALCEKVREEIRRALQAAEAAARHGGEGRNLLRPLRAEDESGGVDLNPHGEERGRSPRVSNHEAQVADLILRDAALRAAPQDEAVSTPPPSASSPRA